MTKYRKKVEKHVEEHWKEGVTLCDFCHRDVDTVNTSGYDATEIEMDAKIGSHYGSDGDARDGYRLDTCSECFITKVKPAIEQLGVEWHEYSPEDAYPSASYGKYYTDDYLRTDGKTASQAEMELAAPLNTTDITKGA